MAKTSTYNPRKVVVTFCGKLITGFADGSMIEVTHTSDAFTMQSGGDGEVARPPSPDHTGPVKPSLQHTSASNDTLTAQLAADRLTNLGTGPLMIKDGSGRTLVSSPEAWIKKSADVGLAKELGTRDWTIDCADLEVFVGGNL